MTKPIVLVLGASGQVGRSIVHHLEEATRSNEIHLRVAARTPESGARLRSEGMDSVLLDLDDPRTFVQALHRVDRAFLLTGYTVAMLAQSKAFVDAARRARVRHLVHLGTFGNRDCTDPHIAWHQLVESYIEASGVAWTHLHPNMFMEQIPRMMKIEGDSLPVLWGRGRMGWIATRDIGAVAATVLREGPERHGGQHYWLSAQVAGGEELATLFSAALGRPIRCDNRSPDSARGESTMEPWYAAAALEFLRQFRDGRTGDFGVVRDDGPLLTGAPSMTLEAWFAEHRHLLE